jgi:tRNA G18 (ribose-2'-O)-methylase SpoU
MKKKVSLILHDVRSAHNVGSLFRSSDALGISEIYLTGYTPAPIDRFGRKVKEIAKTALGAEETISWHSVKSLDSVIRKLKKNNTQIIAIEQSKSSIDYKKLKVRGNTAFILGNEVDGLSEKILNKVDKIVEIPMKGEKESLNVAIAGSVVLFRILNI